MLCYVSEIFNVEICRDLEIWVKGHLRSSQLSRIDPPPTTSCWCSIATMGLSRTVSEIDDNFSRKSKIFPPRVFCAPRWRGSPWNWVPAPRTRNRLMALPARERSLLIPSAVWIQSTNVTAGRTDTGWQQRPRLRIASRGKPKKMKIVATH